MVARLGWKSYSCFIIIRGWLLYAVRNIAAQQDESGNVQWSEEDDDLLKSIMVKAKLEERPDDFYDSVRAAFWVEIGSKERYWVVFSI